MAKVVRFSQLPVTGPQAGDTVAAYRDGEIVRIEVPSPGGSGTVTSVGLSMPAGFSVANAPVTSSGTITVTFAAGYGLPTTTQMGQWSTAFGWGDHAQAGYALASAVTSALAGKVDKVAGKGLSTEDYSTAEKNKLAGIEAGAQVNTVTSVAGKTGAVTLAKGDVGLGNVDNTSDADKPISTAVSTALSGKVDTSDSRLTNSREWTASTVGQAEAEAGTATTRRAWTAQRVWQAIAAWWNASAAKSKLDNIQAGATANQTDAYLLNRANHTGTQAASTVTGLATVATSGSYNDLTNKPSIPAGTVTSVGLSAPTGFSVSGSPVTGSGTLALTFASGYSLPTTAKQGQWDTAYGWGNHASAGYALSSSLATVATSGSYNDLSDKPTLGTAAAANTGDFATAAQGAKADTALQPAAIGVTVQGYSAALNGTTASFTTALKDKLDGIAAGATANTGTVTSVQVAVPTGLQTSGGPVTSSGTITISYASGYAIPTTAKQGQWDQAYGWGNHASAGYALSSSLATVATTGSYNDLGDKPSIPTLPATVGQAEAEAGTATTTRLWTAQRVRQSTVAYAYSKTEVDSLISAATSGAWVWQATTTALPKNTPSKVDFSSPRTLTLPASPAENDYVAILRTAGTTVGSTIARNGQTIMGVAENMTLDVNVSYLRLDYVNSSWRIAS